MIRFTQDGHSYKSIDPTDQTNWIGVSTLVSFFKPPFDPESTAIKSSKNKKSKWYGHSPEVIRKAWKDESNRSLAAGTWYHEQEEAKLYRNFTYNLDGKELEVVKPIVIFDEKHAPPQILKNNHIYPEHLIYLQTEGICGQSDRVEVYDHKVNVRDFKTSKTIKMEGFLRWDGMTQRMREPLEHLDDCNFVHYGLQLSLYMYMILKHNPQLDPGELFLEHIMFELDHEDQFGYPVYKRDSDNNFIVKEIKTYKMPYMKSEVMSILYYLKDNRDLIQRAIKSKYEV